MSDPNHPLREAFDHQSRACAALESPFTARLCAYLGQSLQPGTELTDRLFDWSGNLGPSGESLPLRLCAAFHALRLQGDPSLTAIYPPHTPDGATFSATIDRALRDHTSFINAWVDSPPQTNEVRRSAVLIAAAHWLHNRHALPFVVSELGASAGLNLQFDQFALNIGDVTLGPDRPAMTLAPNWTGPHSPHNAPEIAERRGVDLNPLDPHNPADQLRLRAYLWPDQPHRRSLTDAAISIAGPAPDRSDGIDWLAPRLVHRPGHLHLIYSTVAWQYFPAEKQAKGMTMIEQAGALATDDTPLAWFRMETDGGKGAALTLRLWPGDLSLDIGRADFHGRWVHWTPPE